MALIKCYECSGKVSDRAESCPHCGVPHPRFDPKLSAQLLSACLSMNERSVKHLLNKGADINAKTEDGETASTLASFQGHVDVVDLLLAKGADVNAKNKDGGTALMMASEKGHQDVVNSKRMEANDQPVCH